jgi:hypothetical protein
MAEKWRTLLVKESISDGLIDALEAKVDAKIVAQFRTLAGRSPQELKTLESLIAKVRKYIDAEHHESLRDELQEIKEDNRWLGSKRGRYVLAINSWVHSFRADFVGLAKFSDVVVGGHAKKEVVFVCGKVASKRDYDDLLAYIESKRPPFKVLVEVTVGTSKRRV